MGDIASAQTFFDRVEECNKVRSGDPEVKVTNLINRSVGQPWGQGLDAECTSKNTLVPARLGESKWGNRLSSPICELGGKVVIVSG